MERLLFPIFRPRCKELAEGKALCLPGPLSPSRADGPPQKTGLLSEFVG